MGTPCSHTLATEAEELHAAPAEVRAEASLPVTAPELLVSMGGPLVTKQKSALRGGDGAKQKAIRRRAAFETTVQTRELLSTHSTVLARRGHDEPDLEALRRKAAGQEAAERKAESAESPCVVDCVLDISVAAKDIGDEDGDSTNISEASGESSPRSTHGYLLLPSESDSDEAPFTGNFECYDAEPVVLHVLSNL